jgi:hypothetical protein
LRNYTRSILIFVVLTTFLFNLASAEIIRTNSPDIEAIFLSQDPDPVKKGEFVELRFKLENNGSETIRDVIAEIVPEYPFSIYSGSSKKNIGKIRALQSGADAVIIDFKIKVDEKAAEGDHEIRFKVLTSDGENGVLYVDEDFMVDIEDYDLPEIVAYIKESTILKPGEKGNVIFEIANTGLGDARFVSLTLKPSENFEILSKSSYVYLGEIDSDDTESEEYEIFVNPVSENKVVLPIDIAYQDTNDIDYDVTFDLELRVFSDSELKKFGLREPKVLFPVALVIIILAILYVYYRHFRKKNEI